MQHKKFTEIERKLLGQWIKKGIAKKEVARRLNRDIRTIQRELIRNKTRVNVGKEWEIIYEPIHAHHVAIERKQNAWLSKQPLKSKKIYRYVMRHLRGGWSPEQISGRLREVDHKGEPDWQICMETIYQFVYKKKTDQTKAGQKTEMDGRKKRTRIMVTVTDVSQPLYEYLRRKQVRRRKRGGRKSQRVRIPDRISIHDRPTIVERRKQFGHWEGDSIVGKNHISGLHTEYERVASLIRFERLERITADQTAAAARKIFNPLPFYAKRTTTLDNGSEHTNHKEFGIQAYFADPYASWQRGGNENGNLWIRYYFPKGTDFSTITDEELKDVEWELNHRPRRRLQFRMPQEVFSEYLTKS
jgi:IS30 family transposase